VFEQARGDHAEPPVDRELAHEEVVQLVSGLARLLVLPEKSVYVVREKRAAVLPYRIRFGEEAFLGLPGFRVEHVVAEFLETHDWPPFESRSSMVVRTR